jgi:hypothetical protein
MKKPSAKRLEEARDLLDLARVAQAEFWRSLSPLEACLGVEIDSTTDLRDADIGTLLNPI